MGLVKNRRKNGDHYWVYAFVTPSVRDVQVVEYQSVRTRPSRLHVERADKVYQQMSAGRAFKMSWHSSLGLRGKMWLGMLVAMAPLLLNSLLNLGQVATAGACLLSFAIGNWIIGRYLKPFRALVEESRSIIGNPVMQHVYTGRGDEIGQVALAMKKMKSEARAIIGRMEDAANQL